MEFDGPGAVASKERRRAQEIGASFIMKRKILQFISILTAKSGLLSAFLSIASVWGVKRARDGRLVFPFIIKRKNVSFQVLIFHRVSDNQDLFFDSMPVLSFKNLMEMLAENFAVLPLEKLVERAGRNDVPPRTVAITFDDGYRDNYVNAFPILKAVGLPATIFLSTGALDTGNLLWHDRVFDAFQRTKVSSMFVEGKEYSLKQVPEKQIALEAFLRNLRRCDSQKRDTLIRQLASDLGVVDPPPANWSKLDWSEVREMSQEGISFGAHTVTHPILTRMTLSEAKNEIIASKETIERQLGSSVRLFAYPSGGREHFNDAIKRVLKDADFLCAATTLSGVNDINTDPFELRRTGVWDADPRIFALRLGWYNFIS